MGRLGADLRFALRNLRRSPVFTSVAVASLALGIGANTAIFTLIDQLILRLLPVRDPEQLVMIWTTGPHVGNNNGFRAASYPMYQDFQQKGQAFSHVFCRYATAASISFNGQTERVNAELVSGNFFEAMGVGPAIGRVFSPREDDQIYKGHPVVVLGFDYWRNRFAGDRNIIGQKIIVNDYPMTIVGVSAAGFNGLDPARSPQLRIPIQMKPLMTPGWDALGQRRSQWIHMFARMKPGYTVESAKASLQPLLNQTLQYEIGLPEMRNTSQYLRDRFLKRQVQMEAAAAGFSFLRRSYETALVVLMCMVGLVLLIACFNVANLLIARAAARQKEIAVRLAVGASRRQLLAQLLLESLMLSIGGCILGMLLAVGMIRGLLSFIPQTPGNPLLLRTTPDARILAFDLLLAVLTTLLFGVAPALQALRFDLWTTLKDVVGTVAGAAASVRLRKALVVAQVTFSFLLLAGAGLFVKTLSNLKQANSGFHDIGNLVTFQVNPALSGYTRPRMNDFYKRALASIRGLPGVKSASYATVAILSGNESDSSCSVEGHQNQDGEDIQAYVNNLSPDYWKTMGIQLVEGRDFDGRDEGPPTRVAIVNRKFAQHYFGNRSAIGRHMGFGGGPNTRLNIEIIGVVEDSLYEGPREGVHRQAFTPDQQSAFPASATFYIRTSQDSTSTFSALRRKIQEIDSSMPVYAMKTLENQLDETLSTERLIAILSAIFGMLATLLAGLGVYGVMAFMVARRTKEIGLRMALGAQRGDVVWMVLREALLLLGIGVLVGLPSAYLLSRFVKTALFGVTPTDGWTAAVACAILASAAIAAGFLPARRASTIDPMTALRYE